MSSIEHVVVYLRTPKDWQNWIEVVKTISWAKRVWEYVDPSVPESQHRDLIRPSSPTLADVRAAAGGSIGVQTPRTGQESETLPLKSESLSSSSSSSTPTIHFKDLTDAERMLWMHLQEQHRQDIKDFKAKEVGLVEVRAHIQKHILVEFQHYTHNCTTTYEVLRRLQSRFAPTDRARKVEATNEWRALQRGFKGSDIEMWIGKWDLAYDIAQKLGIPDVQGEQPFHDFLDTVNSIHPSWVTLWREKILEDPTAYTFPDLVRRFRDFHRSSRYSIKPRGSH